MRNFFNPFIAILLLLTAHGCRTAVCEPTYGGINIGGFDSLDLVLVQAVTYKRGTNFSQIKKNWVLSSAFDTSNWVDSLQLHPAVNPDNKKEWSVGWRLNAEEDVIISVPALGREFKIRDFGWIETKHREPFSTGEMDECTDDAEVYVNDERHQAAGAKFSKAAVIFIFKK